MDAPTPVITRRELERRHTALLDLRRYLAQQEREFEERRAQVHAFTERYRALFGPLYEELGALESQLRTTTSALMSTLRSRGIELRLPDEPPPKVGQLQTQMPQFVHAARFESLPPGTPLPPVPVGADISQWAPPTLKLLYRRAAMRLHPDRAGAGLSDADRARREQQMMAVNAAYAASDRAGLEAMLLASGEDLGKVAGGNAEALRNWLMHCEERVQARLRVVNEHMGALSEHSMCRLWLSVRQAEARGLDPMSLMAFKLREQIAERRKEVYISERLKPESNLTRAFLYQRAARAGATAFGA
ncbi:MAG: hypothetical protein JO369_03275 [Paucibacter sp.]|nr:hypothetical protein [Roseateles sp.]